jgi:hypothetical protein
MRKFLPMFSEDNVKDHFRSAARHSRTYSSNFGPVSLQFAALHDAFRGKSGEDIEKNVQMCEPRVLQGDAPDRNNPFETDGSTVRT